MPADIVQSLSLPQSGLREVTVVRHGQPRAIDILAAGGGLLLGMSLLYGSRLSMDILDGVPSTRELLP